ncbi:hypothetical protein SBA5_190008 [Candidatus Sulfotelmatomonas gaucii]|uniref:Uncharacterized protein n=1 Tax=Candidatus Sulfuritelmatomonas gaucii TaxID=2043161 RepID=A0A2N9L720_9BACT|nr:hypothetical protein SBA5_190008 [Candidatus Sulfotelmatomonas gaucii]
MEWSALPLPRSALFRGCEFSVSSVWPAPSHLFPPQRFSPGRRFESSSRYRTRMIPGCDRGIRRIPGIAWRASCPPFWISQRSVCPRFGFANSLAQTLCEALPRAPQHSIPESLARLLATPYSLLATP